MQQKIKQGGCSMMELNLREDEGIILQTKSADFENRTKESLDELILTNSNVICIVRKSTGLFKRTTETIQFPLSSIKIVKGKPQVQQVNDDDSDPYLQILFKDGQRLTFIFEDYETQSSQWLNAINTAVSNIKTPFAEKQKIEEKLETNAGKEDVHIGTKTSEEASRANSFVFCINCGAKNIADAVFCWQCGTLLGTVSSSTYVQELQGAKVAFPDTAPTQAEYVRPNNSNNVQRKGEYDGMIKKCPNCGEILSHSATNCPACGLEL